MNIKQELEKFSKQIFKEEIILDDNEGFVEIEQNLKKEIKKGTLFVQSEISQLKSEIQKSNNEADELKKEKFVLIKELKKRNELLINILQNHFITNTFELNEENTLTKDLVLKKEKYLLSKDGIELLAEVGQEFNPKYHEALNKDIEKKDSYVIEKILEQGYKENKDILKYAKVIIK
ncbi:MAG: nucleotide exchange factor GrpE [Fusobacteriaceae bacterium]